MSEELPKIESKDKQDNVIAETHVILLEIGESLGMLEFDDMESAGFWNDFTKQVQNLKDVKKNLEELRELIAKSKE